MKKRVTCGFLLLFLALSLSFEPRVQAAYPAAMSAAHPSDGLSSVPGQKDHCLHRRGEKEEAHDADLP